MLQQILIELILLATCSIKYTHTHEVIIENMTSPWIDIKPKEIKEKMFMEYDSELRNEKKNNHQMRYLKVNDNTHIELDNPTKNINNFKVLENQTSENVTKKTGPPEFQKKPRRIITPVFKGIGPSGMADEEATTCDQFSSNARFNPYSVLDEKWFCFYNWGADTTPLILQFKIPIAKSLQYLRGILDPQVVHPIDWDAPKVLLTDMMYNATALLVERGDRGQYWLYPFIKNYSGSIEPSDVRFKQTGDNKYMAFMECRSERVYVLSRLNNIPPQKKLQDEAAKIGYRGRGGRSYLYQGHQWMPIPEMDELEYWAPANFRKDQDIPEPIEEHDPNDGEDPGRFFF